MNLNNLNTLSFSKAGSGSSLSGAQSFLLSPSFNTQILLPLDDFSGTTARDLLKNTSGTYVGSPTLRGDTCDDYGTTVKRTLYNGSSQYVKVPTTNLQFLIDGSSDWSIHFVWRYNGGAAPNPFNNPYVTVGFFANYTTYINALYIRLNQRADGSAHGNFASVFIRSAGGTTSGAEYAHNGSVFDGYDHHICVTYQTANSGTFTMYVDGVAGTPTTGVNANMPSTTGNYVGVAASWADSGGAAFFCNGGVENLAFMKHALTLSEQFAIADKYNGNSGVKVENAGVVSTILTAAQNSIIGVASAGDSNELRGHTDSVGDGFFAEGYVYKTQLLLKGALGTDGLAGYMVGSILPTATAGGATFVGITNSLIATYSATDVNSTFIDDRSMAKWNYPTDGGNNPFSSPTVGTGFQTDARWVGIDTALTNANSQVGMNTTTTTWPLASNANIAVSFDAATFNQSASGARGNYYPNVKIGGTTVGGTVVNSLTGANGWVTRTLKVGTQMNGTSGTLSLAISGGSNATGPVGTNNVHIIDTNKTSGFKYTSLWAWGGQSAYEVAVSITDSQTSIQKIADYFTSLMSTTVALSQTPKFILKICMGQNDRNRTSQASIVYSPVYSGGDGSTTTGVTSYLRDGFKNNLKTIVDRMIDGWIQAGYSQSDFYVMYGPYHQVASTPGDWKMQQFYARAERELCTYYNGQAFRLSGPDIVNYTTMHDAGGYGDNGGVANVDVAHLNRTGYALLGNGAGTALFNVTT